SDSKRRQQALQLARRLYQTYPNNQLAMATLGWALLKTGSVEAAEPFITRASQMGSMLPDTAYILAQMMVQQGRKIQAKIILKPYLESRGLFLFRSQAKDLLKALSSDAQLPSPK
ncbi:MAG: tetratricopeptide repeat protein, partial [Planctomycetota bacterium]